MNRLVTLALFTLLAGCQAHSDLDAPDISVDMPDPKLREQFHHEYQQRQAAVAAMRNRCQDKWSTDPTMVAYCEQQQTPALLSFVRSKAWYETLNKKSKLFGADVRMYQRCQLAYSGDYEMAQACVENEKAVAVLSAE